MLGKGHHPSPAAVCTRADLTYAKNALFIRQSVAVSFGLPIDRGQRCNSAKALKTFFLRSMLNKHRHVNTGLPTQINVEYYIANNLINVLFPWRKYERKVVKLEDATKTLTPEERVKSFGYLIKTEAMSNGNITPADIVKQLPPDKRKDLAAASLNELPKEGVKSVIVGLSLPEPEAETNNILWIIFLISSTIIFLTSGIALVSGMFLPSESKSYFVKLKLFAQFGRLLRRT